VRLGKAGHNPIFTALYLGHPKVGQWIVRHAPGATMANLNTTILSNLPFVEAPSEVQERSLKSLAIWLTTPPSVCTEAADARPGPLYPVAPRDGGINLPPLLDESSVG
jgi:hypothetical protein